MNKISFFVLLAAAVIAAASCSKVESAQSEIAQTGIVLHATVDQATATRATLSDGDTWTFAFSQGDRVFVQNEDNPYKQYIFTKGDGDFTCPSEEKTKSPVNWYAYFPQVFLYFNQQSGKKEDVANLYALSGTTATPTTGEKGLSIAMAPQVAILVIDNQKGPIDINVKTGPNSWVSHLLAKNGSAGFDLVTGDTKVSLLTTNILGLHYIAVPAGVQLCIKDGNAEIKSTKTEGFRAGKYYELTIIKQLFTVTFDLNGKPGTAPERIENLLSGTKITKPSSPTAEGYVFIGWYKDKECKRLWNFDTDDVTANTTLYAGWTDELLPGKFTINEDGDLVYFSQGNLWYGKVGGAETATFNFEDNQYGFAPEWDENHVSHFCWSKTASVAYAESYSDSGTSGTDVLFTNATDETANPNFTVSGVTGKYRTLSLDEWTYLSKNHIMKRTSVNGVNGFCIAPDGFNGTIADTYADDADLAADNLVFFPIAGYRFSSKVDHSFGEGFYWLSSAVDGDSAKVVNMADYQADTFTDRRYFGCSVRLVADCE